MVRLGVPVRLCNRLWKPYYRFEHIDIAAGDIAFATVPMLDGSTVGVRYDATQLAALKFEYRTWTRGGTWVTGAAG